MPVTTIDWLDLPVLRPAMPCFGGTGHDTLFATSLSSGVPAEQLATAPLCGAVVSLRAPVAGVPVTRFAA